MTARTLLPSPFPLLLSTCALSTCAAALGCRPSLPLGDGRGDPADPPRDPHVLLEPESAPEAAPPVLRAHVFPAEDAVADASRVLFVRGHVGDGHVRQVEDGDVSQALSERILPALAWPMDDGSVVIAPSVVLDPGATYGILSGDPPLGADVHITGEDPVPLLRRVWPPPDAPAGPFAIFCGDDDLARPPALLALAPGDIHASSNIGVFDSIGAGCLRIDIADLAPLAPMPPASGGATSSSTAPPPLIELDDGSLVRLDPAPIPLAPPPEPPAPVTPLACAPPDIPFGPGCARVADDRLFIATPDTPLLWAVRSRALGRDVVHATGAAEPWVMHGLPPASRADLSIVALNTIGHPVRTNLTVFTKSPMPHVVISEVLANPLGPEPDQEWIELYNDGLAPADLTGYTLADIGGAAALPPAVLAPGAFALVVNETFVEDDEIDPVPAAGTVLLRVPELGKDGLKNDGEPLKLLDAEGHAVSRFPLSPKPKAGHSVARVSPAAPDGLPSSFAVSTPTPGAPGVAPE